MFPFIWIQQARERIRPYIKTTKLTYDSELNLYIKWENQQITGSFKARGALNKILSMEEWETTQGVITASAGNHGLGVAYAGSLVNSPVIVYVGESTVKAKVDAIRAYGAEIRAVPGGFGEAELEALAVARKSQKIWISPYNDAQVIAGQGTIALEILDDLPEGLKPDWLVPVSGGGLISGIGSVVKAGIHQNGMLIGVQAETSAFMHGLFHDGTQENVEELPSIADGLSGPVEANSITIPMVRDLLSDLVIVSEDEIIAAVAYAWERYGERVEGSGAVSLAAVMTGKISSRPAVLIVSGGNIQPELHDQIVDGSIRTIQQALQIQYGGVN
jgi:threonine dehydratase